MARAPKPEAAFIKWSRLHADLWTSGPPGGGPPPDVGIDEAQLLATLAACAKAEAAYTAMRRARSAAKAATHAKDTALAELRAAMGADVSIIDAHAKATKDPGVWERAQIPAPRDAAERTAPPAPTDLRASVDTDGSIDLTFKVASGGGALYLVQRVTTPLEGPSSPYEIVGFAGDDKAFTDDAVPEGLKSVGYRVAVRLTTGPLSDWSVTCEVPFGSQKASLAGEEAGGVAGGVAKRAVPVRGPKDRQAG
ncbi:MAG: hypothetical protein ACIAS6_00500 [Phycisphaerales bacterium JB060]